MGKYKFEKQYQQIFSGFPSNLAEKEETPCFSGSFSSVRDPDWIRTNDLLLRRQLLYPAELPDHIFAHSS